MKHLMRLALAALAMTAVLSATPVFAQEGTAQRQENVQGQAPGILKAENIDKSKPDMGVFGDANKLITAYLEAPSSEKSVLRVDTINKLEALLQKDSQSIPVRVWLGYLLMDNGEPAKAAEVMEPAVGASEDDAVNTLLNRNLAASYYQTGRYSDAITTYERVSAKNSNDLEANRMIGSARLLDGDPEGAIPSLERARDIAKDQDMTVGSNKAIYVSVLKDLGVAYSNNRDDAKALAVFEELETIAADQVDPILLSWMGFQYIQMRQADSAIRVLEKARDMGGDSAILLNNLGNAYEMKGTPESRDKAIELYQEIADSNPNLATPWYNIGSLYVKQGKYDLAIEPLKKAIQLGAASTSSTEYRYARNNLGYCYEQQGKFAEAAAEYAAASDLDPQNKTFARNAGMAYFNARNTTAAEKYLSRANSLGVDDLDYKAVKAEIHARSGQDREALALWEEILQTNGNNADMWFNVGVLRHRVGDKAGAEQAYRRTLEIEPADPDALNNLGLLLYDQGKYDEALVLFEKVSSADRSSQQGRLNLAAALLKADRLQEAVNIWREIIKAQPERHDVRINLADGLWNLGQTKDARFHYATILKAQPKNARALNGMGLWHLLQNETKDAESHFRRAIEADSKYVPPYNNLAIALERLNKRGEAIVILERALKIDPNFKEGRATLERLKSASM